MEKPYYAVSHDRSQRQLVEARGSHRQAEKTHYRTDIRKEWKSRTDSSLGGEQVQPILRRMPSIGLDRVLPPVRKHGSILDLRNANTNGNGNNTDEKHPAPFESFRRWRRSIFKIARIEI